MTTAARMRAALFAAVLAVVTLAANADGPPERRYVAKSGAFSIAMEDLFARLMTPGDEQVSGDTIVIDFSLQHPPVPLIEQRTVEWIGLDKPVDPLRYDSQATELVSSYLDARFHGDLSLADRGKFRDSQGRLVYAFSAKGSAAQMPAFWQGVVIFFDSGVAFPSELLAQPSQNKFISTNGIALPEVVEWATTIRPGR